MLSRSTYLRRNVINNNDKKKCCKINYPICKNIQRLYYCIKYCFNKMNDLRYHEETLNILRSFPLELLPFIELND